MKKSKREQEIINRALIKTDIRKKGDKIENVPIDTGRAIEVCIEYTRARTKRDSAWEAEEVINNLIGWVKVSVGLTPETNKIIRRLHEEKEKFYQQCRTGYIQMDKCTAEIFGKEPAFKENKPPTDEETAQADTL